MKTSKIFINTINMVYSNIIILMFQYRGLWVSIFFLYFKYQEIFEEICLKYIVKKTNELRIS